MAGPKFSVSEFCTPNHSYAEDIASFAAGGAEGIGIAEYKLPEGADAESLEQLRASGLKATICLPTMLSILPNVLGPEPVEPEARVEALSASIRGSPPSSPRSC